MKTKTILRTSRVIMACLFISMGAFVGIIPAILLMVLWEVVVYSLED